MTILNERLNFKGRVEIVLTDHFGVIKDKRSIDNLVVSSGLAFIASRMGGNSKSVMTHLGLGSDGTAPALSQTDLLSLLGQRVAIASTSVIGSAIQYTASFAQGVATGAVAEAAIFNGSSGGDMLCRTAFPVMNKQPLDSIGVLWTITALAAA